MNARAQFAMRGAMLMLLVSATLLQRFGVGVGEFSITPALVAIYVVLGVAAVCGALAISTTRLLLYFGLVVVGVASAMCNDQRASFPSLLLLCAMYFPFLFGLKPHTLADDDARWMMDRFLGLTFFCALVGSAQFFAQFVIHGEWLFNFTALIPQSFRNNGVFNTVIPIGSFYKSNGFFFLEPSGFSLLMGLGLISESVTERRPLRLASYALALLVTYSGTGILALLIGASYPLGRKTLLRLGALACVGGLIYLVFDDALNLSLTLARLGEFNSDRSSGYIRYIAPGRLLRELFTSDPWSAWVGHGPGTIFRTLREYEFHDPTWAKLLFEYGGLGFVMALSLFMVTLRRPAVPIQVRALLFWAWLIMGGHLLSPEQNFLTLALVGLMPFAESWSTESAEEAEAVGAPAFGEPGGAHG